MILEYLMKITVVDENFVFLRYYQDNFNYLSHKAERFNGCIKYYIRIFKASQGGK